MTKRIGPPIKLLIPIRFWEQIRKKSTPVSLGALIIKRFHWQSSLVPKTDLGDRTAESESKTTSTISAVSAMSPSAVRMVSDLWNTNRSCGDNPASLDRGNIFIDVVDAILNFIQKSFDMFRVAVNVSMAESSVVLNPIKNTFEMVESSIQINQIALQVIQVAFKVRDIVDVCCQTMKFVGVENQVAVLRRMTVVNQFARQYASLPHDFECKPVDVLGFVGVRLSTKRGQYD